MALQRHILVLHLRKRHNANTMWVVVLGCLTLCSFSTFCLLLNDWSLLPQAYNPKPLIFGEALFDLGPDLFPIHPEQQGKWNKLTNQTKIQTARLVKRCNDGSCFSFLNKVVRVTHNKNPSPSKSSTTSASSSSSSIERMQKEDGLAIEKKSMLSSSSGAESNSSIRSSKSTPEITSGVQKLQREKENPSSPSRRENMSQLHTQAVRTRTLSRSSNPKKGSILLVKWNGLPPLSSSLLQEDSSPLSRYQSNWHDDPARQEGVTSRWAQGTENLIDLSYKGYRQIPMHVLLPFHDRGGQSSIDSMDDLIEGEKKSFTSTWSPSDIPEKPSVQSKHSTKARRVTFEDANDHRSAKLSGLSRVVSIRQNQPSVSGLMDIIRMPLHQTDMADKIAHNALQKRTENDMKSSFIEDSVRDKKVHNWSAAELISIRKRSWTNGMPTRSSLRPKGKSRNPNPKQRRVTFGEKSEIPSPDNPKSSFKKSTDVTSSSSTSNMIHSEPSKQTTTQNPVSSHVTPAAKSTATSSTSSSTGSFNSRQSSPVKSATSYLSPSTKSTGKLKFSFLDGSRSKRIIQKRSLVEKRAKKRKVPSYASSGESFIHTANHNARYGTSTSAIAPSKKLKQRAPRRDPGSPSHLAFSSLQINSNAAGAVAITSSSSRSSSISRDSLNSITERPGLQRLRSDSLRSTGSSAFRRFQGSPPRFHTSPQVSRPGSPASPNAHSDQWWQNDASSSSSGGTTTFFYR